jgi:hypothetical protein
LTHHGFIGFIHADEGPPVVPRESKANRFYLIDHSIPLVSILCPRKKLNQDAAVRFQLIVLSVCQASPLGKPAFFLHDYTQNRVSCQAVITL